MSTVVQTTFFQGAVSTMCAASGSNHRLNSSLGVFTNSGSSVMGFGLPPMKINSFASEANSGAMVMADAMFVMDAGINRDLVRVLAHHADQKMCGVFIERRGRRLAFRHFTKLIRRMIKAGRPGSHPRHGAIVLFPEFSFVFSLD
jgi:hypothetical protein